MMLSQSKKIKQKQFATKFLHQSKVQNKTNKKQNQQEEHGTLLIKQSEFNSSSEITWEESS